MELTSLRLMLEKGLISQAEYDSAMRDIVDTSGTRAGDGLTFVVSKFAATLYGFAEGDAIWDSTQSFNDIAGNALVARPAFTPAGATMQTPATYAGGNSRMTFGIRNTRFGIRLKSPETAWFRASGVIEADFEGATLPIGTGQPYFGTEAAYFNNPTFRLRHGYVKFETPVVDILVGQTWHLYGWSGQYLPSTVEIQGLPGEVFNRTMQIRLSHAFKSEYVNFELAVAAMRPPQRNSGVPEGAGGLRLSFPKVTGMQTLNSTGTQIAPLSLAVTGLARQVSVNEFSSEPTTSRTVKGEALAVDAFVPIVPATKDKKGNSLSLSGEFSYGVGIADLYTGLTGGVSNPAVPNPTMATPAPTYSPDIDPGIAQYYATPGTQNGVTLGMVKWTSFNIGLQYYFPGLDGRLWIAANFSRTTSPNTSSFLGIPADSMAAAITKAQAKVRDHEDWFDVNLLGDPYPGVRFGLEYARFMDTYLDGVTAVNNRVQFAGFYMF